MALQSFQKALGQVKGGKPPHLLLGNGFSRACRDDIFSYASLFARADFGQIPRAAEAFDALDTQDFEVVMDALHKAAQLVSVYAKTDTALAEALAHDAEKLKDVLVSAIAENHPDHPFEIPTEQYANAKAFLAHFDRKFTVNYDLLLYWTVMQSHVTPDVPCDDGFRKSELGTGEYVSWEPENTNYQNIYYLHGALHIFDSQVEVQKYTWAGTGVRLIDQVREALDKGLYPLFVAEGESSKKWARIRHSDFLDKTYRSLMRLGGTMFLYGHSLAENDDHILRGITKSKISQIFVSIYGDPDSPNNKRILKRAERMATDRKKGPKLEVAFYDSSTARVWK